MTLKIWQFDPANLTPYYNMAVCDALGQAGCEVHYLSSAFLYDPNLPTDGKFIPENLYFRGLDQAWLLKHRLVRRSLRALTYPLGHMQVRQKLGKHPPDIFHAQWSRLPRTDYELLQEVKKRGVPLVHTVHDVVPLFEQKRDPFLDKIYGICDAIIVHSQANRATFLENFPHIPPEKVHIIPHIALRPRWLPPDASQLTARNRLGLPPEAPIWLFFGGLRPYKGVDILIAAFEQIAQQNPDLHLMIVGNPDRPQDRPNLENLGQAAERVYLKMGYIPYEDMWLYHLAADGVVCPYRHIYQSGALITAMSFGRAVIATQVGSFPETVDGNGWLIPPEDPRILGETLLEAASQPETVRRMGQRSLELIESIYAEPLIAAAHIALYERLKV